MFDWERKAVGWSCILIFCMFFWYFLTFLIRFHSFDQLLESKIVDTTIFTQKFSASSGPQAQSHRGEKRHVNISKDNRQFDDSTITSPAIQQAAQGQIGQRITGTSAKGVRMKRSKASRMGTIGGTQRLTRAQQTNSHNI